RLLMKGVETIDEVSRFVEGFESFVETLQQLVALVERFQREIIWQRNAADTEITGRLALGVGPPGIAFHKKCVVSAAEIARLRRFAAADIAHGYERGQPAFHWQETC